MTHDEAIKQFKEEDRKPEGARWLTVLMMNPPLRALAVAWEAVHALVYHSHEYTELVGDRDHWNQMWETQLYGRNEINEAKLSLASGLSPSQVHGGIEILRANRLIYPDGTLSPWCEKFILTSVAAAMQQMAPKPAQRANTQPQQREG